MVDRKSRKSGRETCADHSVRIHRSDHPHRRRRQASGANIKIADLDEGSQDRHVTISGTPEQIHLAEFLIHSR